jgi:hypothetical protein
VLNWKRLKLIFCLLFSHAEMGAAITVYVNTNACTPFDKLGRLMEPSQFDGDDKSYTKNDFSNVLNKCFICDLRTPLFRMTINACALRLINTKQLSRFVCDIILFNCYELYNSNTP